MKFTLVLLTLALVRAEDSEEEPQHQAQEDDDSYSFHKFRGPVSGEVFQIVVPGYHHQEPSSVDYVAKPDYGYSYGVHDPKTDTSQMHREKRQGDAVIGEYRVLQPDGLVRVVKYKADAKSGFQASVTYEKS